MGSVVVKSRLSVGSVAVVSVASSVALGVSTTVSLGTAVDPEKKPSSSIVLSSFVVWVAFTFIAFVKKACVAVVNTDRYVPVFFMITFDVDVVA